jgi:hypothetical protein
VGRENYTAASSKFSPRELQELASNAAEILPILDAEAECVIPKAVMIRRTPVH